MTWCCRVGCNHYHLRGIRSHKFCCNACRRGEVIHTHNCSGHVHTPLWCSNKKAKVDHNVFNDSPCARHDCPFFHSLGPRAHGFCCNACRLGESTHTNNCSGQGQHVLAIQANQSDDVFPLVPCTIQTEYKHSYIIPEQWACNSGLIVTYIEWYMQHTGLHMTYSNASAWDKLEKKIPWIDKKRNLVIYVLAEGSPFLKHQENVINVHSRGLDANEASLYKMSDVTGIDFAVQAKLASQSLTAEVILEACRAIEIGNLKSFAFVCSHATHRSCACAVLLANLAYHDARIVFSTHRTNRAASVAGLTLSVLRR
jgi:hypothetical protein